ncbi:phosphoadenosine phosphosulfate reductase [Janthinobacterium agaricidamnosum]|uniref:Phosphoadenosine phosphosulfate reductase n=1 Tax=Janthinobacterium agaricidamnosum TaxID=55508 RepID=A0A3G2EBJ7_9BURK|nr:phosphoadenosine phosphosulfate reductase family protein [Janthinobacterium agaricidamnosum]AYM76926.1 phosphoadenosine phosphosulfate reductase [Janthinobacterium agaricidamnosum]
MDQSELLVAGIAQVPEQIIDLIARGALFVINHSGGKDSQAMYLLLRGLVPAAQRVIVHADLGAVEWAGAVAHIRATTAGEPLHICRSRRTLLEMIEERGMFPSPQQRQCTSDLKRGPIERTIRAILNDNPQFGGLIVNCMGMRAEESSKRAKLVPFQWVPYENSKGKPTGKSIRARASKKSGKVLHAGREWFEWLPIHGWSERQVFDRIAAAGQQPHIIYSLGMSRFSCVFCIMASEADLRTAARLATERPELLNDPHLYPKYVGLERSTGQVMMMPSKTKGRLTLEQITGISAASAKSEIARTLCE